MSRKKCSEELDKPFSLLHENHNTNHEVETWISVLLSHWYGKLGAALAANFARAPSKFCVGMAVFNL